MADESVHELTPAYALDALDEGERAAYEAHLAGCEACRRELAAFSETAAALAYGSAAVAPPAELRSRILAAAAAAERPKVVPLGRRSVSRPLAAVAAAAACLAVGLGVWAATLRSDLSQARTDAAGLRATAALLADPGAQRVSLGTNGALVVDASGDAALVTRRLPAARPGKVYEAWVIADGRAMRAGLLRGGHGVDVLRLSRPVRRGDTVAVTVERAGGVEQPTGAPLMQAQA